MAGRLQTVALEDDLDGPLPRAPRSRRPGLVVGLVAAVAVLGLVVVQGVVDARARARLEAVRALPGVLLPVAGPVRTLWQAPADGFVGWSRVGDHLVGGTVVDGRIELRDVDRAHGTARWTSSVPVAEGVVPPSGVAFVACEPLGDDPRRPDRVACVAGELSPGSVTDQPVVTQLVVVRAADGRVVDERRPEGLLWATTRALLVTATSARSGEDVRWTLRATRPDGTAAWTLPLPAVHPIDPVDAGDGGQYVAPTSLTGEPDGVLLEAGGTAWFVGVDGRLRTRLDEVVGGAVTRGRTGALATTLHSWLEAREATTELVLADGTRRVTADTLVVPSVDDGSAAGIELVGALSGEAGLGALDGATGASLWRAKDVVGRPVLLDGRLYAATGAGVVALDARTGREIWRRAAPPSLVDDGSVVVDVATDGVRLVAISSDRTLRTYALDDGAAGWSGRAAGVRDRDDVWVSTAAGMLVVTTSGGSSVVG
ncbi:outer membrane protein assembly factor BamB family protein [Cellulomonas sp. P5_C6]